MKHQSEHPAQDSDETGTPNSEEMAPTALVCPRRKKNEGVEDGEEPVILTRELLESYFNCSLAAVSKELGICPTSIKKACRKLGIAKWPF
eukprot:764600-Hanusia_phi.AAC.2